MSVDESEITRDPLLAVFDFVLRFSAACVYVCVLDLFWFCISFLRLLLRGVGDWGA